MTDLSVGDSIEMKGSGAKPYVIKNCGEGGWSCTCPAWRNQSLDPRLRTCKHIRKLRGDAAEQLRLASVGELAPRIPEGAAEGKSAPPLLLAETWDGATNLTGWWMSEKLDGVRAYWDGRQFISRYGNLFLAPDWFLDGLPDVPLDGELWIARKAFQRANGIARRQDRGQEWEELRYVVFDAPAHGGAFEARLRFLDDLLGRRKPRFARTLEHQQCRGNDHLWREFERVQGLGGEGLMLRQPGSKYIDGRSASLLKVKPQLDAEARVIGYEAGEGKHKGTVGALKVELPDGKRFKVGTGLTDAQRRSPPPIGAIITFGYQELTDAGIPRFPRFLGVRDDGLMTPMPKAPAAAVARKAKAAVIAATPPPDEPAILRRLQFGSGKSASFWEVMVEGNGWQLTFGQVGGVVRNKRGTCRSPDDAKRSVEDMITEKLEDGFVEVDPVTGEPYEPAVPAPSPAPPRPIPAPSPAVPTGPRRFEYVEGASSKFWTIELKGTSFTVKFGRIGSGGQTQLKTFDDEARARREHDRLIAEKVKKGYVEKP